MKTRILANNNKSFVKKIARRSIGKQAECGRLCLCLPSYWSRLFNQRPFYVFSGAE